MTGKISVKLFFGCEVNFILRSVLAQSSEWKNDKIEQTPLSEVQHDDKSYLGILIEAGEIPLRDIKKLEELIRDKIQSYCPKVKSSAMQFYLFPQIYLH